MANPCPVKPSEFKALIPNGSQPFCVIFSNFLQLFVLIWKFFKWMVAEDGGPTQDFLVWIGTSCTVDTGSEQAPTRPLNLAASSDIEGCIRLTWDNPSSATHFMVLRGTTNDSTAATEIIDWTAISNSFNDTNAKTGMVIGTEYYYWVKVKNAVGESPLSESDSGIALAETSGMTRMTAGKYTLRLEITGDALFYFVGWAGGGAGGWGCVQTIKTEYTNPINGTKTIRNTYYPWSGGTGASGGHGYCKNGLEVHNGDVITVTKGRGGVAGIKDGGDGGATEIKITRSGQSSQSLLTIRGGQGGRATVKDESDDLYIIRGAPGNWQEPAVYDATNFWAQHGSSGNQGASFTIGRAVSVPGGLGVADASGNALGTYGAGGASSAGNDGPSAGEEGEVFYKVSPGTFTATES